MASADREPIPGVWGLGWDRSQVRGRSLRAARETESLLAFRSANKAQIGPFFRRISNILFERKLAFLSFEQRIVSCLKPPSC